MNHNTAHASPVKIVRILTRMNIGGPAIHAAILSKQLDPRYFSTCLVVGEPDDDEGDLSGLLAGSSAKLIRVKSLRRAIRPRHDLVAFAQLLRILWSEQPAIIHTHMAKAGTLGRLAGLCYNALGPGRLRNHRAVLLHTFHGHVLEGYFPLWLSHLFVIIEQLFARHTDRLIAVSDAIRSELLALGIGQADQWQVIPLGLDLRQLAEVPPAPEAGTIRCGMVGRLVPVKNPSLFLSAFEQMVRRDLGVDVTALIVGDGPLRPPLEAEAQRRGLNGRVHFTGWRRDLAAVYTDLDIVCLTSWNEGTPVAMIEAMAAARPVVATAVGGVPDVLGVEPSAIRSLAKGSFVQGRGGLLVHPGDGDGLAAALAACAQDSQLRRTLGQAGRASVIERYAHTRLVRDITSLYDNVRKSREHADGAHRVAAQSLEPTPKPRDCEFRISDCK